MIPYDIEGPALISFSGGRTSGYMLRRILDVGLRPDVHVVFADTGRERAETYTFVRQIADAWGVTIAWVQRPGQFTQLITDRQYLPNPVTRFCTQELKIRPMRNYMLAHGYTHWTNVVGIRADEPRRIAKMRENAERRPDAHDEPSMPLAEAGVTREIVEAFWRAQPFDLALRRHEGNCDLCFLKGVNKRRQIIRDRPDLAAWWIEQERRTGRFFRHDSASYAQMAAQGDLFVHAAGEEQDLIECMCHD